MRQVQLHEIIACQSPNSDVVGAVFQRLHPSLVSLSYRYLGNSEDAQDVVMVSWMKVLERLSSFQYQHPLSFYAWIKKICVNECLGILRLRNNFNLQSLQDLSEEEEPWSEDFSDIDARVLLRWVADLPEGYRTVFNLFAVEGFSHAEIAQMLEISESTSKSQYRKARLRLLRVLQNQNNRSKSHEK
jgi:RNA polymerase sigma-70 factor (ECF subfamily)